MFSLSLFLLLPVALYYLGMKCHGSNVGNQYFLSSLGRGIYSSQSNASFTYLKTAAAVTTPNPTGPTICVGKSLTYPTPRDMTVAERGIRARAESSAFRIDFVREANFSDMGS